MKKWFMQFAVSKSGLVLVPIFTGAITWLLARLALPASLAEQVPVGAVAEWCAAVVVVLVLQLVNKKQGDGVVKIQGALDMTPVVDAVTQDRYAGPKLYAEVRRAIAVAENAPQKP
jgi:hypothetical protein